MHIKIELNLLINIQHKIQIKHKLNHNKGRV